LFILLGIVATLQLFAQSPEGGMWRPEQLTKLDQLALEKMGLSLSSDDLYHPAQASLKDAIVSFGGFCTAAFISSTGLLLTNHHCAYGAIQAKSRRGRNLLQDGFWAANQAEELPNPGLAITILVRTEDVTSKVLAEMPPALPEKKRRAWLALRTEQIETAYRSQTGLQAEIKPGFAEKSWLVHLHQTYTDIRLVGTPPVSIARFGGDAAGRAWPMHTADFALFRVYADTNNAAAAYSRHNIPYQPTHYLPISLNGVKPGDFTLIPGYPGHTEQYLSSFAIQERLERYDPNMVCLRTAALEVLLPDLTNSKRLRVKYSSMYSSLHNTQASLQGEMEGLRKLGVVERRRNLERRMAAWISEANHRKARYGNLLQDLRVLYQRREMHLETGLYLEAALSWIGLVDFANDWRKIGEIDAKAISTRSWNLARGKLQRDARKHFRNYSAATDEKMCARILELLYQQLPPSHQEVVFPEMENRFGNDFGRYAAYIYARSHLVSGEKTRDFLRKLEPKGTRKLRKDPGYQLMERLVNYYNSHYRQEWQEGEAQKASLQRRYKEAILEMNAGQMLPTDADGSLRYSFGNVAHYEGKDGIRYRYCTTTEGILEKYQAQTENFDLPQNFVALLRQAEFGIYGQDAKMPVNFMATNYTGNGNSGSPVLDGKGRVIGLNSARTLESAMSDLIYDQKEVRNVAIDIRYILFVMEHFAGAKNLLEELDLQH
ncbi:MAG TPA: S46 family peptidase, partial [Bacteroidetes bacterium]|nr:S46 family peptidase [Bacteroidota bacterium]